jgi:hypothetical protein
MSNGVNQCAACGGLWDDDEPHAVCPSDPSPDPTDKAVALLKSIGLDITYTDEGLRVVAEQIGRLYVTAPRTLTADDVLAAVNAIDYDAVLAATPAPKTARAQVYTLHALTRDAILILIHDGEATPEVKPCSTCGEPVAYLTARPGWAGGWLHHPARPLDGHPAAIDGEATT